MTSDGTPFTVDDLRRWVLAFRRACERAAAEVRDNPKYGCFRGFPRDQCWNASHWLADFLHLHCGVPAAMICVCVNGLRQDGSHAWLRIGDWIVDITPDQFADGMAVDYVTSDDVWHKTFNGTKCDAYQPPDENDSLLRDYFDTYELIFTHLDHSALELPPEQRSV